MPCPNNICDETNPNQMALAEHWNGSGWSVQATPHVASATYGLAAVSCVASDDCIALGGGGLGEHWNGSVWQLQAAADGVNAVSCASAGECTAVGADVHGYTSANEVVARYTRGVWSPESVSGLTYEPLHAFFDVSCVTADICVAVGAAGTSPDELQPAAAGTGIDELKTSAPGPVAATPLSRTVLFSPSVGSTHFELLTRELALAAGSRVNTVHGTVQLGSLTSTDEGQFSGGTFTVLRDLNGHPSIRLVGGTYASCSTRRHGLTDGRSHHRIVRELNATTDGGFRPHRSVQHRHR